MRQARTLQQQLAPASVEHPVASANGGRNGDDNTVASRDRQSKRHGYGDSRVDRAGPEADLFETGFLRRRENEPMRTVVRPDYQVRVAKPEDAEALGRLLQASYTELMASAYDARSLAPALKLMTRVNSSLLVSGTYYVAEAPNGDLPGCGGWTREQPGTGIIEAHLGHIRHFAVHPAWVRRGIGAAIYAFCESAARAAGVTAFECYSSLNAERFYCALGFKRVREIDLELQPRVVLRAVFMRRDF